MKRIALAGCLITLLLVTTAQARSLSGVVVWVNQAQRTTGLLDSHHRLHVLRYRGTKPRVRAKAAFTLRHGYAVLVPPHAKRSAVTRRRAPAKPGHSTKTKPIPGSSAGAATTTGTSTTTASSTTSASSTISASSTLSASSATAVVTTALASTTASASSTVSPSSTASGSTTTTTTATTASSSTSAPPVPSHVETWAYDDGCNGGTGASASLVQSWLSFAESNCGTSATKAQADCHAGTVSVCTSLAYLDANKIYARYSMPIAQDAGESWWLHTSGYTDAAHRVLATDGSWGSANVLDQANPAVRSWVASYAGTNFASFDGLMMDDTGPSLSQQLYGAGVSQSQELTSDNALLAAHESMAAGLTKSDGSHFLQVDNSLDANPWLPTPFPLLGHHDGVHGFVAEGQPVSGGSLTPWYSSLLDDLSYIDGQPNAFIALLSYDDSGSLTARRLQGATVLLAYSAGHVVSWSDLEQSSSNLAVWPEEGLYPTRPVQSMRTPGGAGCLSGSGKVCSTGGHTDLQVAPGVYRREFRACYNRGVAIGPCAAIVNDTSSAVVVHPGWLSQNYAHQISMNGGDVQSGGSLNLTSTGFTAGATSVPADDAMLLAS